MFATILKVGGSMLGAATVAAIGWKAKGALQERSMRKAFEKDGEEGLRLYLYETKHSDAHTDLLVDIWFRNLAQAHAQPQVQQAAA